jgi:hypothetical protein
VGSWECGGSATGPYKYHPQRISEKKSNITTTHYCITLTLSKYIPPKFYAGTEPFFKVAYDGSVVVHLLLVYVYLVKKFGFL